MTIYRHMNCPLCQTKLLTTNSRPTGSKMQTWRRKSCLKCGLILSSKESLDLSTVIKVDSDDYSRARLIKSVSDLVKGDSEEAIMNIVSTVEIRALKHPSYHSKVVLTKSELATELSYVLKKLDRAAYLRHQAKIEDAKS
jgi:transcriptional regulator NrdR family protein